MATTPAEPLDFPAPAQVSEAMLASSPRVPNVGAMTAAATSAPEPDDLEPIVVLDDEPIDVLTRLMQRSREALHVAPALHDYLAAVGVSDPAVWSAFRLGAGSNVLTADLTETDWTALADLGLASRASRKLGAAWSTGLNLPTFDPRHPDQVVGVIRLTPAHHQHRFLTRPAGIACATDIANARRIILADVPLLGLRLANYGVTGVAIVEDPAVLPPLLPWLSGREIIIAGFRAASRAAIRAALGPLGAQATEVMVLPEIERSPLASKELLGFGVVPRPEPLSGQLLRDLHRYARMRVSVGDAATALRSLGIDDAHFMDTYAIGYLPADFHRALSTDQRRVLGDRIPGHGLVIPAFNTDGIVVDLMLVPVTGAAVIQSVHDAPCGLIAARVATSCDHVIIVDALQDAADLAAEGHRNVLLVRGPADATANASRLVTSGVRRADVRCTKNRDETTRILRDVGIQIVANFGDVPSALPFPVPTRDPDPVAESPSALPSVVAPPDSTTVSRLVLVAHDERTEQATFTAEDLTYVAEVPWDERTRIGLRISRGGHEHPDRLDLGEDAQRRRCASSAALRTGASSAVIADHLTQVHVAICELASRAGAPRSLTTPAKMSETDRAAALERAKDPRVFDRLITDLGTLGWIGEESAKRFTVLAALSRNLDQPLWTALTTSTLGERSPGLDVIAAITPPEQQIRVSRLSDNTFYCADPTALCHKLLILDDAQTISSGVSTALRVLRQRGALSAPRIERDPVRGNVRTTFVEIHGPIAVLTASTGAIDPHLQPHVMEVAADESPGHIAAVLAERRRRLAQVTGKDAAEHQHLVARLRNLQRVLLPRRVTIPFAERITGFGTSPRAQRDHETLLGLIAAHALLHQHQRPDVDGSVVATVADFTAAAALMHERMAVEQAGLGQHAQRLLAAITAAHVASFTMQDLARLLPEWNRHAFRSGLTELIALDYIVSPRGGRGAARVYHVVAGVACPQSSPVTRVTLRPSDEVDVRNDRSNFDAKVGELAKVGEIGYANFTGHQDTG